MNYNLDIGINLNDRTLYLSIPENSDITELKYICKTDKNNYIAEDSTGGYYHYNGTNTYFYDSGVNVETINLPENFGTIIEIDNTSVLYEFIERVSHEKVYVTSEDYAKQESMSKDDITTKVENEVSAYGVQMNSVIGFDGTADEIPDGYEITDETFGGGGGETLKVGTILPYSGTSLPTGYMLCDGSALSRTEYADLFSVIGTKFGVGDGSTTFNLPNLKGKVPVGLDSTDTDFNDLGLSGGEKTHTLTSGELPAMSFTTGHFAYSDSLWTGSGGITQTHSTGHGASSTRDEAARANSNNGAWHEYKFGNNQAHNNLQPYLVVNYIIKVAQTTAIQAQVVDGYSTSTTDAYSANYVNKTIKGDILWTNPDPTSNFDSQAVTLSTAPNYDAIGVWMYRNISNTELQEIRIKNGTGGDLLFGELYQNVLYIQGRNFNFTNSTTLNFSSGFLHATNGNTTVSDNTRGIPAFIVGYKRSVI